MPKQHNGSNGKPNFNSYKNHRTSEEKKRERRRKDQWQQEIRDAAKHRNNSTRV